MDIQDLRIFTRVAAVQNLSSVGHEFALTPGTISKRLQSLEDELGVRLFVRSTRSIRITEEGSIFLDHAQRMLVEFDTAKASVDGNMSRPRGLIKLCAPAFLGAHDLALGLSAFASAFPEIDVHVELCDRWTGPADDGFDMMIRLFSYEPRIIGLVSGACIYPSPIPSRHRPFFRVFSPNSCKREAHTLPLLRSHQ